MPRLQLRICHFRTLHEYLVAYPRDQTYSKVILLGAFRPIETLHPLQFLNQVTQADKPLEGVHWGSFSGQQAQL